MASRAPRVGIVGTFDVENYGDLLFPLIAHHELASRIPGLEVVPFSYYSRDSSSWPYHVRSLTEFGDEIEDLDLVLIGGGHVIRFDKTVAFGYLPPAPSLHHPTAYGLMPALLAGWTGVPVAWNAVGVSPATPGWATTLLAEAARAARYLAVRDPASASEVAHVAAGVDVRVVPDTAFGVAALVDGTSRELHQLREELGVRERPYVVYQPSPDFVPFRSWLVSVLRRYAGYGAVIVELPISPCLGDRGSVVDVDTPTVSPKRWPSPLALAGLISAADAVVARSLHLSITALASGVPVIRRSSSPGSKYRVLEAIPGVHIALDDTDDSLPLGRSELVAEVVDYVASLKTHWDTIAALVEERPPSRVGTLLRSIGRLTELEEAADREAINRARLQQDLEAAVVELEVERGRGSYVDRLIAERDERLLEFDERVLDLDRRLRATQSRLEQVESSKSWALTRPLRWTRAAVDRRSRSCVESTSEPRGDSSGRPAVLEVPVAPPLEHGSPPDAFRDAVASPTSTEPVEPADDGGGNGPAPVPLLERVVAVPTSPVKKVAFYLPQFHPIPENDAWWGRGFTEWTNVTRARPLFEGHDQPHRPGELGYYDLRVVETQRRQVELARLYGIDAFCFYFYWFDGKRLLERPLLQYLDDPALDLPFCLCWANESWSRRWDGSADDILIEQHHSDTDDVAFIDYVARYLDDPRYLRVNDRPLIVVYRPGLLPDPVSSAQRWRDRFRATRGGELFIAHANAFDDDPPSMYGFDASIEFPPVRLGSRATSEPPRLGADEITSLTEDRPHVFDGRFFVEESKRYSTPNHLLFRGVCPGWDNTPRAGKNAYILSHTPPVGLQTWLKNALVETEDRLSGDERLVFINAWNEWGEGCYLEPDERSGYASLEAVRVASVRAAVRPRPPSVADSIRVAAVVHSTDVHVLAECLERIESLPEDVDCIVTTTAGLRRAFEAALERAGLPCRLVCSDAPGDTLPFLNAVGLGNGAPSDIVLKLHAHATTCSPERHEGMTELLDASVVREVVRAFAEQPQLGLVGAASDRRVLGALHSPGSVVDQVAHRLGVADVNAARDTHFPSGIYFVRCAALAPLQAIELPADLGDADRTVGACVGLSVIAAGFRIEDTRSFNRAPRTTLTSSGSAAARGSEEASGRLPVEPPTRLA